MGGDVNPAEDYLVTPDAPKDMFGDGFRLGFFMIHALMGLPIVLLAVALHLWFPTVMFAASTAVGWYGWWKFYRFHWRIRG